jgi:hypothetical protein
VERKAERAAPMSTDVGQGTLARRCGTGATSLCWGGSSRDDVVRRAANVDYHPESGEGIAMKGEPPITLSIMTWLVAAMVLATIVFVMHGIIGF